MTQIVNHMGMVKKYTETQWDVIKQEHECVVFSAYRLVKKQPLTYM